MKKLIGLTGPSGFSSDCMTLIEKELNANFVLLYHEDESNLKEWLRKCDAFLVSGGLDVHPSIYDRNILSHNNLSKFDLQRDLRELSVIDYAIIEEKPLFGICRGHQLIGLYCGIKGSDFCMDLTGCNTIHQPTKINVQVNKGEPVHCIDILKPELFTTGEVSERDVLKNIFAEDLKNKLWVNSFHHQGLYYNDSIKYKEKGIDVIGVASADFNNNNHKIIEAMIGNKWISVQWHPEFDYEVNTPSKTAVNIFKEMIDEIC